ncbi:MAG: S41 family peptidase, partial [Bacteroidota bacterium]
DYLLPTSKSGYLANIAHVRVDTTLNIDIPQMAGRYLHPYHSTAFSKYDRKRIRKFMKDFRPVLSVDQAQFSDPYYMMLHGGRSADSFYYNKPVYVLADERSFSAASVFVASLKGIPNVKIAGLTTDGSSGLSKRYLLKETGLVLRISRMVSFQPDGLPLDGYGTKPDIALERDLNQLLGRHDSQLEKLLEYIQHH